MKGRIVNQDIRMDELVARARKHQPGLIVVDRAVPGINQNYLTPENRVPEEALPYPWESCIIAGGGWSWVPDARYKSVRETVHLLVDIVAKGGNLLLNIAPGPDGTWHDEAYTLIAGVGEWLDVNGKAIYGTRAVAPYKAGEVCFSRNPDSGAVHAIYLASEGEKAPPSTLVIEGVVPEMGAVVTMLGVEEELEWQATSWGLEVTIPEGIRENPPCHDAWTFRISAVVIDE